MLIFELAMLALLITLNVVHPGKMTGLQETLIFMLAFGNLGLFYNFIVQKTLANEAITMFIQFIVVSMFTLSQLLTNTTGIVLGAISLIVCCVNVMLVAKSEEDSEKKKTIVTHKTVIKETPAVETKSDVVKRELAEYIRRSEISETPKQQMVNPNIVNVNVDANGNSTQQPRDDSDLKELRKNDEKISDKIEVINLKMDSRMDRVDENVKASISDVKKEIDYLKKKEKKVFIASTGGKKLHNPNCMVAQRIPEAKRVLIHDMEEAIKKGYTACSVCCPVQEVKIEAK
ncbi:hypothetical protein COT47_00950 [Candidatus Woesearchaeota archaeon CG08_land_8_20_14_0_20_43_7]|nr:MAG: hypothetical protein COT47_00950 [Candidatus Woesearchaeota archaeon CG08_land_8_20_14_0_20_43_7]